jgi:hypothetical protein
MRVGLFFEDEGHRSLVTGLCQRLAALEQVDVDLVERNISGGAPMALRKVRAYARELEAGISPFFEILVVAIDGNCVGATQRREMVQQCLGAYPGELVVAVPDPHVECWYLADRGALSTVLQVGVSVERPPYKCERGRYKAALRSGFAAADVTPPAGGAEFGADIAEVLDLDRATRNDRSLDDFVSAFRAAARRLANTGGG